MFDDVCNVQITNCTVSFEVGVSICLFFQEVGEVSEVSCHMQQALSLPQSCE